jgi:hypothetical protein
MQWHVRSVEAPERLCVQAMDEEGEGGAHLGGRSRGGRRQQKGHVGDGLALNMAGAAAEAVMTAADVDA